MRNRVSSIVAGWLLLVSFGAAVAWAAADPQNPPLQLSIKQGKKTVTGTVAGIGKGALLLTDKAGKEQKIPLAKVPEADRREALIHVVGSGVVVVNNYDIFGAAHGVGSGFVFRSSGLILTNYHVVRGAGELKVEFRDVAEPVVAECLAVDQRNDVAILKVAKLPAGVHVLEIAAKEMPKQGVPVWTIGHPRGLKNTASWGDINAVRKSSQLPEGMRSELSAPDDTVWIQSNAVILQGSSGSPLLNAAGQAIGMNSFIAGPQLGFALRLKHAAAAFDEARSGKALPLPIPPAAEESALAYWSREAGPLLKGWSDEVKLLQAQAAGKPAEAIEQNMTAIRAKYRPAALEIARRDAESWPSFQAASLILQVFSDNTPEGTQARREARELLLKHHLQSKDLATLLQASEQTDEESQDFYRRILQDSPHKSVRTAARVSLTTSQLGWLNEKGGPDLKKTLALRAEIGEALSKLETELADLVPDEQQRKEAVAALRGQLDAIHAGQPSPEISGIDAAGTIFKLSEFKGKVVLLDFFADWCPWCRKMYPAEKQMVERLKNRPFALLGVNTENQAVLTRLVAEQVVTWRTWADGQNGPIARQFQIESFPTLFLIDAEGIVRAHYAGSPSEEDLNKAIESLLVEAERSPVAAK